jgi:hypothetical protein
MPIRNEGPHPRLAIWRSAIVALIWLMGSTAIAHAHGGMAGPDELGPPLFTSVALGFVCYWLVILWPSSKHKDQEPTVTGRRNARNRRGRGRAARKSTDPQHLSRVTKVAGRGRS